MIKFKTVLIPSITGLGFLVIGFFLCFLTFWYYGGNAGNTDREASNLNNGLLASGRI